MGPRTTVCPLKLKPPAEGAVSRCRSCSDGARHKPKTSPGLSNPKSVLKRPVSTEELQRPGGPYLRKTFTVVGDALGWGFVVRGCRPCHIQAVEPSGPAAAAGLRVRQFLLMVNGVNVLHLDYRTVSLLILTGPRTVVMEVLEENQDLTRTNPRPNQDKTKTEPGQNQDRTKTKPRLNQDGTKTEPGPNQV